MLLLDEPFGALDAKVRKDLRRWLRELHRRIGTTTVFVTHDQEEALELADRVVIMNRGRIEQAGTVDEVYEPPATPDTAPGWAVMPSVWLQRASVVEKMPSSKTSQTLLKARFLLIDSSKILHVRIRCQIYPQTRASHPGWC